MSGRTPRQLLLGWIALLALIVGCGAPAARVDDSRGPPSQGATAAQRDSGLKRVTIALKEDVPGMSDKVRVGPGQGTWIVEELVNAGLVIIDGSGAIQPQHAEQVPSLENGLWTVKTDGTMELTWRIKRGVKWHDSTPFTSADLLFTAGLEQDPQVPLSRHVGWGSVDSVSAPDPQSVVALWKQPYIDADLLFSRRFGMPVAKHLLERAYLESNLTILQHPYWTTEFVGTGPYRVKEFVLGSHLIATANDDYVLGRPKLDEVELRFISDGNALAANILSGAVDGYLAPGLSIEQGVEVRNQWRGGRMEPAPGNWLVIHPQLLNPTPPVVNNLQFRRALLHAVDRLQLVESLQHGLTSVAHTLLHPNQPQNREIEAGVIRYEYDPRKAEQMIADLGYTKGADGSFRDLAGQMLVVELRTTNQIDLQTTAQPAVADYWQKVGVVAEQFVVPVQRQRDPPFRATFPAFELLNGPPSGEEGLIYLHSSKTRLPESNFVGSNYPRYMNPEFDALLERFFVTIPKPERIRVLGQIIRHMSENLNEMGLIHTARPVLVSNRLAGLGANATTLATEAWNSHLWDVR